MWLTFRVLLCGYAGCYSCVSFSQVQHQITCVQILKLAQNKYMVVWYCTFDCLLAQAPGVLQVIMGHFAWRWVVSKN